MSLAKNSPALKVKPAMCAAGASVGVAAATASMTLVAFAEENTALSTAQEKIVDLIQQLFGTIQSVAGPLFGLIALICLVAMGFCVLNNNSNGLRAWRAGLFGVLVLLALIYVVPTIVNVAADFGSQVNGSQNLEGAFNGIN